MRFSLFSHFDIVPGASVAELYTELEKQMVHAERLGFDAVWLPEHHFDLFGRFPSGRLPSPLIYLARLSALTQHIALGTAVIEAPYYHPLRLAEDTAVLDVLSGGRIRLGIGSGDRHKSAEFAQFGVSMEERTSRTQEVIEVLQKALSKDTIDFLGEYYQYQGAKINPRPIQSAEQLIWPAASNATIEIAGMRGYPILLPRSSVLDRYQPLLKRYRAALNGKAGFIALLRFVYVAETERKAQEETRRALAIFSKFARGVDWDGRTDTDEYQEILHRMGAVIGTPDQVTAQLIAWQQEFGFQEVICQVYSAGIHYKDASRSIELLARTVLPTLQAPTSRASANQRNRRGENLSEQ